MAQQCGSGFVLRLAEQLSALNYPYDFDESLTEEVLNNSFADPTSGGAWKYLRDVVVVLEDSVIRRRPPTERSTLRMAESPAAFLSSMLSYVGEVASDKPHYQFSFAKRQLELLRAVAAAEGHDARTARCVLYHIQLLCDIAIALYTRDEGAEIVQAHHAQWQQDQPRRLVTTVDVIGEEPRDGVAATTSSEEAEVRELLRPIYAKRGVTMPANTGLALEETVRFVKALKRLQSAPSGTLDEADELLDTVPLFNGQRNSTQEAQGAKGSSSDAQLERAAKALRLLFMADLRQLQDAINASIGEMQNYTATCRVDTSLGRVGR